MFKEWKETVVIFFICLFYQLIIFYGKPLSDVTELYLAFMVSWGGTLYTDFVNPHAPLHALMYGYLFKIIQPNPLFLLLSETSVYAIISVFVYHICRYIGLPKKYSVFASFLFIFSRVWTSMLFYGDSFAALFIIIGAYTFIKYIELQKPSLFFLTGLFFGISLLFKQNIGLYGVIAVCVYSLYDMFKNKKISYKLLYFILGVSLVLSLIVLYFYSRGSLNDFVYVIVILPFTTQKLYAIPCSPINIIYLVVEVSIIGILMFRVDKRILFLSLLTLFVLGRNTPVCYSYSSVPAFAPFTVLVSYIIYNRNKLKPYLKPFLVIITIIFIGIYITEANRLYSEISATKPANHYHWLNYSDREVVKFIKSNTNISDKILTIPSDYSMNIITQRQTMKYVLAGTETTPSEIQNKMIEQMPAVKYITVLKNPNDAYPCFQILFDYINSNYRIVKEIDNVILLEKGNNTEPIFQSQCKETLYISNITLEDNKIVFHSTPRPPSIGYYNKVLNSIMDKVKQWQNIVRNQ